MMLHANASPRALGIARFAIYGTWVIVLLLRPTYRLADLPTEWFKPFGPLALIPQDVWGLWLRHDVLLVSHVVLLTLCAMLAIGVRPFRPLAALAAVLLLMSDMTDKGFNGFANHAQMALLYAAWILPFFPAADGFGVARPRYRESTPWIYGAGMATIAGCMATAYSILGIRRFADGGIEIFTGDAILVYLSTKSLEYSHYNFEYGLLPMTIPALAALMKLGFFLVTLAEVATPFVLFSSRLRRVWLIVIGSFHIATIFTMNIFFWENLVLMLVFFTGLADAAWRSRPAREPATAGSSAPQLRCGQGSSYGHSTHCSQPKSTTNHRERPT